MSEETWELVRRIYAGDETVLKELADYKNRQATPSLVNFVTWPHIRQSMLPALTEYSNPVALAAFVAVSQFEDLLPKHYEVIASSEHDFSRADEKVNIRVTDYEAVLLDQIRHMLPQPTHGAPNNQSDTVRFCIAFTRLILEERMNSL